MDKKKKIILGATAAALVVVIGAVVVTQGSRLKTVASVAQSATMNEEQVAAKNDENEQMAQELQDEYQIPDIMLTPEMQAAIANGSMTLEEAAAQLISGSAAQSAPETADDAPSPETSNPAPTESVPEESQAAPEVPTPEPVERQPEQTQTTAETPKASEDAETAFLSGATAPEADSGQNASASKGAESEQTASPSKGAESGQTASPSKGAESGQTVSPSKQADSGQTQAPEKSAAEKAQEEKNAKIQNLFAQLYVLRDSFNARLDGVINECIDEFLALDPSEQTKMNKVRIVYARMDAVEAMEAECDAKVESIAAQLDELDPELGAKARQYYQNEKELKKASLISQYGGG